IIILLDMKLFYVINPENCETVSFIRYQGEGIYAPTRLHHPHAAMLQISLCGRVHKKKLTNSFFSRYQF
ncbi:MAG: hypothetical protein II915_04220, partial [Eubacterium sp.]|nr:hypothetical protein [Eubacterium sp.]